MTGVTLRPIFGGYEPPGLRMALHGIPVYERSITLHTLEETTPMLDVMGQKDVCLMSAHGILVVGRTVEEVTHKSIVLETLARLNYFAALRGDVAEISDEDKAEWNRRERAADAREAGGGGEDGGNHGWDHYVSLVNEPGLIQFDDVGLGLGR